MAIGVAGSLENRRLAAFGDRQKVMRVLRGTDGIDRDLHVSARAIFETDRARETARQLAMALTLSRAGANGPPAHQIGDVLR